MKRIDEFCLKLEELLKEFDDLSYMDIVDELNYYAYEYQSKANRSV